MLVNCSHFTGVHLAFVFEPLPEASQKSWVFSEPFCFVGNGQLERHELLVSGCLAGTARGHIRALSPELTLLTFY